MSLYYDTLTALRRMSTFDAAKAHIDTTKPYARGGSVGFTPLGKRAHSYRIMRVHPSNPDMIEAFIGGYTEEYYGNSDLPYGKPFIRWYRDGRVDVMGPARFQKSTEGDFVEALLGWRWRSQYSAFWVRGASARNASSPRWIKLKPGAYNTFLAPAQSAYSYAPMLPEGSPLDAPHTTHVVNRTAMNAMRAQYADFLNYAEGMAKLLKGTSLRELALMARDAGPRIARISALRRDRAWRVEGHEKASQEVAAALASGDPEQHARVFFALHDTWEAPTPGSIRANFDHWLLFRYPGQLLTTKEHTDGKIRKDVYHWAFAG